MIRGRHAFRKDGPRQRLDSSAPHKPSVGAGVGAVTGAGDGALVGAGVGVIVGAGVGAFVGAEAAEISASGDVTMAKNGRFQPMGGETS